MVTVIRPITRDCGNPFGTVPFEPSTYGHKLSIGRDVIGGVGAYNRRSRPYPGGTVGQPIIMRVDRDLYPEDVAGIPFPAGQLWVSYLSIMGDPNGLSEETYTLRSGFVMGSGGNTFSTAVPSTLPAGYTVNNQRNCRPIVQPIYALAYLPSYAGLGLTGRYQQIRTADGMYFPPDLDNRCVWGPNGSGMGTANFSGSCGSPPGFTPADNLPGPPALVDGWCAGYRAMTVLFSTSVDPTTTGMTFARLDVWALTDRFTGTLIRTVTVAPGAFVYDAASGAWICDAGNIGSFGGWGDGRVRGFQAIGTADMNVNFQILCSPRIDIPFCWTASSDHPSIADGLMAPGGVLTGTVPGF